MPLETRRYVRTVCNLLPGNLFSAWVGDQSGPTGVPLKLSTSTEPDFTGADYSKLLGCDPLTLDYESTYLKSLFYVFQLESSTQQQTEVHGKRDEWNCGH